MNVYLAAVKVKGFILPYAEDYKVYAVSEEHARRLVAKHIQGKLLSLDLIETGTSVANARFHSHDYGIPNAFPY